MEQVIKKETQSEQVARYIERKIATGHWRIGEKLPSFRELARQLDVSFQVIKSAISIVERKSLVINQPRVGIYVNPQAVTSGRKNVIVLSGFLRAPSEDYIGSLLSLSDDNIWHNVKFTRHIIPKKGVMAAGLQYEIELIQKENPDCLLVSLPNLDADQTALFADVSFPVVFIGDFHDETIDNVKNQIIEDTTERARAMINAAVTRGKQNIVMMAGTPNVHYIRLLRDTGIEYASECKVEFHYFPFADEKTKEQADFIQAREKAVYSLLKEHQPDAIVMESFAHIDLFIEIIEKNGLSVPDDLVLVSSAEMHPGLIYIKYDYTEFSRKVSKLIGALIDNPNETLGRKVLSGLIRHIPLGIEPAKKLI